MPRILILQLKRIGDLILTAPALAALRSALPQAEIVLLAPAGVTALAECIPAVNRVIPYRAGRINLDAWSSAIAGPWDACLDFTGTDRSALLTGLSRAKRRIGFAKFSSKPLRRVAFTELCEASVRELHTLDFHAALVGRYLDRPDSESGNEIPFVFPSNLVQSVQTKLSAVGVSGPYAMLHPGTAKVEKFWPASRWVEVAAHVAGSCGFSMVLTGAPEGHEREHLDELRKRLTVPVADLTGALSLPEFAAIIEGCGLMLGVDSMAAHLAAMFRRPQVVLFGPTNPFHWRPRHQRAAVLAGAESGPRTEFAPREKPHPMSEVSTAAVIRAIGRVLARSPSAP